MKTKLILLLAIVVGSTASATMQIPDKAIYDGKEYWLERLGNFLMESYFKEYPDMHSIKATLLRPRSTALWRGYVATYEVKDRQLYLKDMEIPEYTIEDGNRQIRWESVMDKVFPDKKPLKIDWASGLLVLEPPRGETRREIILLEIDKGDIKKEKQFADSEEYKTFKAKQFQAFKKTKPDEYKKAVEETKKFGRSGNRVDDSIETFITRYSTKILVD